MNIFKNSKKANDILSKLKIDNPDFRLWDSLHNQIEFILSDFDTIGNFKKSARTEDVKKIIIGVQAIREIEQGNPSLADLLCEIDYEYKKAYGLNKI